MKHIEEKGATTENRLKHASFRTTGYGTRDLVGDLDFFPNGGEYQPGCPEKPAGSALSNILHGAFGMILLTC